MLDEIDTYVLTDIVIPPFWKLLFINSERVRRIEGYQDQLAALLHVLSSLKLAKHMILMIISLVPALLDASHWRTRGHVAKDADQQDLNAKLDDLDVNHLKFAKAFGN